MAKWGTALQLSSTFRRETRLSLGVAKCLRRAQRRKPVSVIVHNRRDSADARYLHSFARVYDHPLSFLSPSEAASVLADGSRRKFAQLDVLPANAKLIGAFGFLNNYNGIETSIRALHHL